MLSEEHLTGVQAPCIPRIPLHFLLSEVLAW